MTLFYLVDFDVQLHRPGFITNDKSGCFVSDKSVSKVGHLRFTNNNFNNVVFERDRLFAIWVRGNPYQRHRIFI